MYHSALPSGTDILIKTFAPVETKGKAKQFNDEGGSAQATKRNLGIYLSSS